MDSITMRERDERVGTRERIKFGFFFLFLSVLPSVAFYCDLKQMKG
jgi:hypothetical protein